MDNMTELEDANGHCYIDLTKVMAISGPMQAKSNPESRKVILPTYVVYIANSKTNCEKLGIAWETNEGERDEDDAPPKRRATKRRSMPWMRRAKE